MHILIQFSNINFTPFLKIKMNTYRINIKIYFLFLYSGLYYEKSGRPDLDPKEKKVQPEKDSNQKILKINMIKSSKST